MGIWACIWTVWMKGMNLIAKGMLQRKMWLLGISLGKVADTNQLIKSIEKLLDKFF
jgi:hypothetical protein